MNATLAVIEDIIASSGTGEAIEALLPTAVRSRQLTASTLLAGMMLALADGRPAHLTRAHTALLALPDDDQKRLGVIAGWKDGPHQLTYRQVEHTARLIKNALAKQQPDGAASANLQQSCGRLLEASIPAEFKNASSSLAVDWTDVEAWSRPVPHEAAGSGADPEARWGHRNVNLKIQEGQMFFGYYLSAATMVKDENSPAVPELVRRITVCNSAHDPATAMVPVLQGMAADGIRPGDILADSGFSHRQPGTWAVPLRGLRASLVVDLHPSDRGPAAERLNSSIKDTATTSIDRGWIRLMGVTPLMLWLACLTAVRNQRILTTRHKRQQHTARLPASGQPPRTRKRRRELASTAPP